MDDLDGTRRSDYEHDEAVKIIKVLVRHKIIPVADHEEAYLRTYQAAFEILDLLKQERVI